MLNHLRFVTLNLVCYHLDTEPYDEIGCLHMADVQQFLRECKVLYRPFMKFAMTCSLKEFLMTFQSPFLVGQDLYQGELMEKTIQGYNPTFRFEGNENDEKQFSSTLSKHIFYFHSTADTKKEVRFLAGRTATNDLVIVDYTISKQHAAFIKRQNRFLIVDQQSTNGTTLNMNKLEPLTEYPLRDHDLIAFGRLGFVIMKPIKLFLISRNHENLGHTIQAEFVDILKYVKRHRLDKIASNIGIVSTDLSKKDLVQKLLKKISAEQMLEMLF